MKVVVYEPTEKPEPVLRLRLVNRADGAVDVLAVDEHGERMATLVRFDTDGRLKRLINVPESVGIPLSSGGCVIVV